MKIKVEFDFYPEPDDVDEEDECGLTEAAFVALNDALLALGADDVSIVQVEG